MKRGHITIPETPLGRDIAAAIQAQAVLYELLRELEAKATGQGIRRPGGWRHRPMAWAQEHGLDD